MYVLSIGTQVQPNNNSEDKHDYGHHSHHPHGLTGLDHVDDTTNDGQNQHVRQDKNPLERPNKL
jgi:hypothetical protein